MSHYRNDTTYILYICVYKASIKFKSAINKTNSTHHNADGRPKRRTAAPRNSAGKRQTSSFPVRIFHRRIFTTPSIPPFTFHCCETLSNDRRERERERESSRDRIIRTRMGTTNGSALRFDRFTRFILTIVYRRIAL